MGGTTEDIMFINLKNDGYKLDSNHDKPIDLNDMPLAFNEYLNRKKNIIEWNKRDKNIEWEKIWCFASIKEINNSHNDLSSSKYMPKIEKLDNNSLDPK